MDVPLQLSTLTIPSLIYAVVLRRRGTPSREIFMNLGWRSARPITFLWSLCIVIVLGAGAWVAFQQVPPEVVEDPKSMSASTPA